METPSPVVVRPARPADGPALTRILRDTFESTWRPNLTPAAVQAYRDNDRPAAYAAYAAERGLKPWVAERDGQVVGFVDWEDDFVHALHVLAAHARIGVGAALMDKAEAAIRAAGFSESRLETDTFNTASQAFYLARGYVEAGQYPDLEWNSGLTTVLMIKPLG